MRLWHILFGILIVGIFLTGCTANYANFAQCLTEKNITMYGTFECHFCAMQKEEFGSNFAYVNYVECDPDGPNSQAELCKQKEITGYPTWKIQRVMVRGRSLWTG